MPDGKVMLSREAHPAKIPHPREVMPGGKVTFFSEVKTSKVFLAREVIEEGKLTLFSEVHPLLFIFEADGLCINAVG